METVWTAAPTVDGDRETQHLTHTDTKGHKLINRQRPLIVTSQKYIYTTVLW